MDNPHTTGRKKNFLSFSNKIGRDREALRSKPEMRLQIQTEKGFIV